MGFEPLDSLTAEIASLGILEDEEDPFDKFESVDEVLWYGGF